MPPRRRPCLLRPCLLRPPPAATPLLPALLFATSASARLCPALLAAHAVTPVAVAMGAAPALADPIGDAAKKPSEKAYPFMKEVKWDSYIYNVKPGAGATAGD